MHSRKANTYCVKSKSEQTKNTKKKITNTTKRQEQTQTRVKQKQTTSTITRQDQYKCTIEPYNVKRTANTNVYTQMHSRTVNTYCVKLKSEQTKSTKKKITNNTNKWQAQTQTCVKHKHKQTTIIIAWQDQHKCTDEPCNTKRTVNVNKNVNTNVITNNLKTNK